MKSFHPTMVASMVASAFAVSTLGTVTAAPANLNNFNASSQQAVSASTLSATAQRALAQKPTRSGMPSHYDAQLGKATFVWQGISQSKPDMALIAPEQQNEYAANYYLNALTGVSIDKNASSRAVMASMHDLNKGPVIAKFKQELHGVEIFNREYNVMMDREHNLVAGSGYLASSANPKESFAILANFTTAEASLRTAFKDLAGIDVNLTKTESKGGYTHYQADSLTSGKVVVGSPRVKKVFFEINGQLEASYYIEAEVADANSIESNYFSYVVQANNGKILFRNNLSAHATEFNYRAYADQDGYPWEGPHGDVIPAASADQVDTTEILEAPMISIAYYNKISTQDPWLPLDATTTSGNNVFAYADVAAPQDFSEGDFTAEVTSANTFDYPYKTDQLAESQDNAKAAIVNLFYMNNFLHDFFYDHGFNETAYVAQKSNYGRGGIEGDPIEAQAQDSSGLNNANMATPADGASPRMQMYLYNSKDAKNGVDFGATVTSHANLGLLGSFQPASFGLLKYSDIKGDVVRLIDGNDTDSGSVNDGCEAATNGADLAGKIAIIDRGSCNFTAKVKHAQDVGAIAAIVVNNNNDGTPAPMGGSDASVTIPSIGLNYADGHAIYDLLEAGETVSIDMFNNFLLKDGTFDNGIIAHEWGHYISNRLVGNSAGLNNFQGRAMGEGWGDFHSLMFIAKASDINIEGNDKFQKAYGSGTFVEGFYSGIRRLPYSTDTSINALSFRHITEGAGADIGINGTSVASPHAPGEIWGTMLWESYVALINKHGFEKAQSRMANYLVAGYKMTPVSPLYTEARDGILAAAYASDREDYALILGAFAKRGMGLGAVSPARNSTDLQGVVESDKTQLATYEVKEFSLNANYNGAQLGFCSMDNILDKGETGTVKVTITNKGSEALSGVKGQLVVTSGQDVTFENGGVITFGDMAPFESASSGDIMVTLNDAQVAENLTIEVTFPEIEEGDDIVEALKGSLSTSVHMDFSPRQPTNGSDTDDMEDPSVFENWKQNIISGDPEKAGETQSTDNGGNVPFFANSSGVDLGAQTMFLANNNFSADVAVESMAFDVGTSGNFEVSFWHFYGMEDTYDGGVVEIKVGDGEWMDVTAAGGTFDTGYAGPLQQLLPGRQAFTGRNVVGGAFGAMERINFGTAHNGKKVQLRFRVVSDTNTADFGWWIDNVTVNNITSPIYTSTVAGDSFACDNAAPILTISEGATINEGTSGQLSVAVTDRNASDTLTYKWTQVSGPSVSISDADKASASFSTSSISFDAAKVNAELVFQVEVSDGSVTTTAQTSFVVNKQATAAPAPLPTSSGGGSMGLFAMLLLPFAMLRRRRK